MKSSYFFTLAWLILWANAYSQTPPAFPGAEGFGAITTGGRGGQVIYVTTLNCNGPGSLNEALSTPGPKYILFKVSGVIDCAAEVLEGNCYIAGQTSPKGIIVRGIIADDYYDPNAHPNNIIIRHLRSRGIATHPTANYATDPIIISGVENAIIDHCSFSNSEDEAVDISRSSNLSIQYCLLAETLGGHYDLGGMLLNYSSPGQVMDNISIHHNNWNRIGGRMPEFSCEDPTGCIGHTVHIEYSNNLLWDQGIQVWYNADADLSNGTTDPYFLQMNVIGNYAVSRNTYCGPMFDAAFLSIPQNQLYYSGNHHNSYPTLADYELFFCCNDFCQAGNNPNTDMGVANLLANRHPFPTITYENASSLPATMIANVGAFPRFPHENRLMQAIQNNTINTTPLNVAVADDILLLPTSNATAPVDTDNDGMPDYWENANGLNPNLADHNGTQLSQSITGVSGYTNLECYLNCLAESLVTGSSTATCGIATAISQPLSNHPQTYPNPTHTILELDFEDFGNMPYTYTIFNLLGESLRHTEVVGKQSIEVGNLPVGLYYIELRQGEKVFVEKWEKQ